MRVERVVYKGIEFRRYPDAPRWAERNYYRPSSVHIRRRVGALHQEVWRDHFGPIPPGHHIHHRDEDTGNNDPGNLECLTPSEHSRWHAAARGLSPGKIRHLDSIRPKASGWHRSAEGRAWHRANAKRIWAERTPHLRACGQCGAEYESTATHGNERFCSNACRSKWRRAAGLDDEDRTCLACGATFRANRYGKQRTCSRVCGQRLRRSR